MNVAPGPAFVHETGSTSPALIPIALGEPVEGGRIPTRDLVLLVAGDGGLTWCAIVIEW